MSAATLSYWCAPARTRGTLEPVAIVTRPEPAREVVVECGPLRVRGLDVVSVLLSGRQIKVHFDGTCEDTTFSKVSAVTLY